VRPHMRGVTASNRPGREKGKPSMFHFATSQLSHLLATYGYWAVLVFVAIEETVQNRVSWLALSPCNWLTSTRF
jgi:hypothetical protein